MIRPLPAAALTLALAASSAGASASPLGTWNTPGSKVTVKIAPCGDTYCATVVALRKPLDKQGRPKTDKRNPDASKRSRPVIGLSLVSGIKADGDEWTGRFYNPDDGRTYDGRIAQAGADKLRLTGCLAEVLCKSQTLTRAR